MTNSQLIKEIFKSYTSLAITIRNLEQYNSLPKELSELLNKDIDDLDVNISLLAANITTKD
ncbi:hypothetical protein QUW09_02510 [Ligilactobacillus salivarius]|uniref:hypothetical protein n=1 Tax=Ligilactobacillus salivarius TaxID=1624 RepID=UPI0021044DFC|nr:hypothetical protein [Ligilactobacillus salivarius]MDM8204975.1 hypothetical protein [Ligilactobacillus salivarius]UTX37103.1 hypothetical protein NNL28_02510 [Ligilactobacillus salivarius]